MFKKTDLETGDGQKIAVCMDCGFHILVNQVTDGVSPLEWDPSPAERRWWTDQKEIKFKGGSGGPHQCGPNPIESFSVLTVGSNLIQSQHETIDSVGDWAVETFGRGLDPAAFAKRILSEAMEFALVCGVVPAQIRNLIDREWDKFRKEFYNSSELCFFETQLKREQPKELADIAITVYAAAKQLEIDLVSVIDHAMAINRTREWTCHGDGTGKYSKRSPLEDQRKNNGRTLEGSSGSSDQGGSPVHPGS